MAILGTLSTAFFTNMKDRKITFFLNGVLKNTGNVTYTTGDVISLMANEAPTITFDTISIVNGVEKLTNYAQQKIAEFRITATEPFHIVINETFTSYPTQPSSFDSWEYISAIQASNCDVGIGDDKAVFIGCNWLNSPIKITARNGFKISNIERLNQNAPTMTISADGKEANGFVTTWGNATRFLKVTTVADDTPPPKPDMLVTQADLDSFTSQKGQLRSGSTILKVGDKYVQGSTITYFTNEKNYIVDSVNFLDGGKEFNRIQTTNNFATTYPHEYSDKGLLINVVGHYQEFFVDQTEIDDINAQNSKLYVNGVLATNATKLNVGDEIKVVANSGYKYFMNEGYSSVYSSNANTWLDLTDDETVVKFTINRIDYPLGFAIETVVIKPDVIKGVNNVYKLTYEQTKQIIRMDLIDDTIPLEPKPIGHLLLGLLELPFSIPSDMIIGKQNVNLGGFPIDINADVLADDKLTIDFGNIIIPNVKNNLLDFKNVTTVLNMPYVEKMFLEPSDVIGQTINVQMVINLYDSMATVNVSSSKNSKIILSKSIDLKLSIPFGDVPSYPKGSNPHDVLLAKDNGVKTAFIEVIQNDVLNENGLFTIPVIDENLLYSQNGYVEIEKIDLKSNASKNEKDDIINLLNRGVIIK